MKKINLSLAVLALGGFLPAALAQAPEPAVPVVRSKYDASAPATPTRNTDRFLQLHASFLARGKAGPIGVLFVGDSIVNHWRIAPAIWDKYFGKYQPANFGIPGDMTQNVIWRLEHGEFDGLHPRVVVFMLGTNNTSGNTAAEIFAADKKIIDGIRAKIPETKILLLGIFPREARKQDPGAPGLSPLMTVINAVNAQLATLDDGRSVRYLDLGPKFIDPDGQISPAIMADGVHPTVAGFQVWADAMQPLLDEMMQPAG
jgi:beta-glucosidase